MTVVPLHRPSGNNRPKTPDPGSIIAALDVGSTKISCLIATVKQRSAKLPGGDDLEIQVIGAGHQAARGIKGGVVNNLDEAERAIRLAVDAAERMAKTTISCVHVNVSGGRPQCFTHSAQRDVQDDCVSEADILAAVRGAVGKIEAGRRLILHAAPVQFHLDDARGVRNPIGMYGDRLSVDLNAILVEPGAMRNLAMVIERCHLDVAGFVIAPYASGRAVLVEDELSLGTTLIDMGGATTSVAVFHDGQLCYADVVPVGGDHITRDLARGLSTTMAHAERLKTLYGNALSSVFDDRDLISVPLLGERGVDQITQVPRSMLTGIIRPRLEETFELVRQRLDASSVARLAGRRAVLTGGASQLTGIREAAAHILDRQVRLAAPHGIGGLPDAARSPSFSVASGLLRYALKPDDSTVTMPITAANLAASGNYFSRVGRWIKESF